MGDGRHGAHNNLATEQSAKTRREKHLLLLIVAEHTLSTHSYCSPFSVCRPKYTTPPPPNLPGVMFIAVAPNIFASASDLAASVISAMASTVTGLLLLAFWAWAAAFQAAAVMGLYVAEEGRASRAKASVRPLARHMASRRRSTFWNGRGTMEL